ncbi:MULTISPECIES: hypothetical protein [unclassified Thalassospira]|jgi:membrane protein implicated in regulation of membrane protease activity|uniref:hypothetical protein n=1 Tax=unclassified Thalassospira TaxID=2648997 RepID=UPI000A1D740B|nr:hypothetical protein [Thalassospira sp. MCCC 1A01428]OSQ41165.1 hypothetical protein THS27_19915 [Thalassospira sp. MCCC 1A01428]
MNKIAAILIAAFVAIVLILGFVAIIGGSLAGALMVVIGIPFAFPTTTTLLFLVFMVLIIRTVFEQRRKRREIKSWLDDDNTK